MTQASNTVTVRDSTLREGLDTPGVSFSPEEKLRIAALLDEAGVPEVEIVAPSRVSKDLAFVPTLREAVPRLVTSGLLYSSGPNLRQEIREASAAIHRFDLLMPVSERRKPAARTEKIRVLLDGLDDALSCTSSVGVGFPHSFQVDVDFLLEIAERAVERGAQRVTVYDTNGSADPFVVHDVLARMRRSIQAAIFFHGHNDLGQATANALAAVRGGATGLDLTVNGLGDRAGNGSLEQVAIGLHLKGVPTGIVLQRLKPLCDHVETVSGVPVSKLSPVVGEFIVSHRSPSHLDHPDLFEAFNPDLVGATRRLERQ